MKRVKEMTDGNWYVKGIDIGCFVQTGMGSIVFCVLESGNRHAMNYWSSEPGLPKGFKLISSLNIDISSTVAKTKVNIST